jgi:nitrite reductase (NADH) small subunit
MMPDWIEVGIIDDIPRLGARVIKTSIGNIGVFRTAADKIFALRDECPHQGGPLSQGMVHGDRVTCPLHNWNIELTNGEAVAPDEGCAASFPIKLEGNTVYLSIQTATNN